jgi:hypothetical protein
MRNSIIKSTICLGLCLLITALNVNAQEKPYREPDGLSNWYVELGGAAGLYSLNFEQTLYRKNKFGWVGRIGFSYDFSTGYFLRKLEMQEGAVRAPFHTAILLGDKLRKEKIELGLGVTLISNPSGTTEYIPTAAIGFRVIETNKVCFRVLYTPFIRDLKYENWFGVSIGRNFAIGKKGRG